MNTAQKVIDDVNVAVENAYRQLRYPGVQTLNERSYSPRMWRESVLPDVPDYCRSYDPIMEVIALLSEKDGFKSIRNRHRDYLIRLMTIVNRGEELWDNGKFTGSWHHAIRCVEATPMQMCEAFLVSMGQEWPVKS